MAFKIGETVIWKKNGKKQLIVGDQNTSIDHQLYGKTFPKNENNFFIKEISDTYAHPIEVNQNDLTKIN